MDPRSVYRNRTDQSPHNMKRTRFRKVHCRFQPLSSFVGLLEPTTDAQGHKGLLSIYSMRILGIRETHLADLRRSSTRTVVNRILPQTICDWRFPVIAKRVGTACVSGRHTAAIEFISPGQPSSGTTKRIDNMTASTAPRVAVRVFEFIWK
eukprot:SAG31_NODE_642_length_13301_cov_14.143084_8_plen_151_part_00